MKTLSSEPVAIPGAIMAVIVAGFGLAVLMGAPLSPEQVGGFITLAGAVIALVTAIQRHKSVPSSRVLERLDRDGTAVLAGEANDLVRAGVHVRTLGEQPRRANDGGGL